MRHLKTYQLFENSSTIKDDLQDIFLELQDNGYYIGVNRLLRVVSGKTDQQIGFTMDINKYDGLYLQDIDALKVLYPLEHAIEYMRDNGYSSSIDVTFRYNVSKSDIKFRWSYDDNDIQIQDFRKYCSSHKKIIKIRVTFRLNQ